MFGLVHRPFLSPLTPCGIPSAVTPPEPSFVHDLLQATYADLSKLHGRLAKLYEDEEKSTDDHNGSDGE